MLLQCCDYYMHASSLFHWELVYIQIGKEDDLQWCKAWGLLKLANFKKRLKNSTHVSETTNNPSQY